MKDTTQYTYFALRASTAVALLLMMLVGTPAAFSQTVVSGPLGESIIPSGLTGPDPSAMLDIVNPQKGLLIPRVALTATTSPAPISAPPLTSLLVYNTATANDVTPGYYYWDGTQWLRFGTATAPPANAWLLTGNANATLASFLGTTTPVSLNFKANGLHAGHIDFNSAVANTSFGLQAGNLTMTGIANTAVGNSALQSNTTGTWNTAVGNIALRDNTTGNNNTATGDETLTANTTGSGNTADGEGALFRNTTGSFNTATGYVALQFNTTGANNTASGRNALSANVAGNQNTATGEGALQASVNASFNTADGVHSLYLNTTGTNNTGSGVDALRNNVSGSNNTAAGRGSLITNSTGDMNTAIGYSADISAGNLTNATAVGANAVATASNQIRLGDANVTTLFCQGAYVPTTATPPNMVVLPTGQILRSTATAGVAFTHYIGELFGGGIIFYLYRDAAGAEHGLIASLTDLTATAWSNVTSTAVGATAQNPWNGLSNSNGVTGQTGHAASAANVCRTYSGGGFNDWYLPSMDELSLLFDQSFIINKTLGTSGWFVSGNYWSSNEDNAGSAVMRGFGKLSQNQGGYPKGTSFNVRAVRSF